MEVTSHNKDLLHLSVSPGIKSWSIFVGALSVGIGAAYYSPEEHILMKTTYLVGCLVLGLTFLDDWEDCIFNHNEGKITMTKRNWFEWLLNQSSQSNSLTFNSSSVLSVCVLSVPKKQNLYCIALQMRTGSTVTISETAIGTKIDQELQAGLIRTHLCLDRVQVLSNCSNWTGCDDQTLSFGHNDQLQVESLHGDKYRKNDLEEGCMDLNEDISDSDDSSSDRGGNNEEDNNNIDHYYDGL